MDRTTKPLDAYFETTVARTRALKPEKATLNIEYGTKMQSLGTSVPNGQLLIRIKATPQSQQVGTQKSGEGKSEQRLGQNT